MSNQGVNASKENKFISFIKGLTIYAKIFVALSLVLFLLGICTLGSFNGGGQSALVSHSNTATSLAYQLTYQDGQSLSAIYVNIGAVYGDTEAEKAGQTAQVRAYYYDGKDFNNTVGSTTYFANVLAKNESSSYISNANYNWVAIASDKNVTQDKIRLTFTANRAGAQVNEVVFVDSKGDVIKASVAESHCQNISKEEVKKTLDAQGGFKKDTSFQNTFTYDEQYILASIHGVELGGETNKDGVYTMSTNYNSFGVLVYALSFWLFGKSTFGLRLPSFLSAFGIFILLFFLGGKLLKDDKFGLLFSATFALGGTLFGLGRMGTPMVFGLFLAVAGIYLMYRFYAKGVDGNRPVTSALPVLFSGLCLAGAFAVNSLMIFPAVVALLLFAFGIVRIVKEKNYLLSTTAKTVTNEEGNENVNGEAVTSNRAATIKAQAGYKIRVASAYLGCAVIFGFLLLCLSSVFTNGAFVRCYGDYNFFELLGKGVAQCFTAGDITPYAEGNALTAISWVTSLKGATAFYFEADGLVSQVNFQIHPLMAYAALLSFLCATAYIIAKLIIERGMPKDKAFLRIFRGYIAFTVGAVVTLAPSLFIANISQFYAGGFSLFYLSFIPLALYIWENGFGERKGVKFGAYNIVAIVLYSAFTVIFALTMPMVFGWAVPTGVAAGLFGWTAIFSNGQYGILPLVK